MPNSIRKRLRLHQDWSNDIPLKNIWGINFSARTGSGSMTTVGDAIEEYVNIYRPRSFKVDKGLFDRVSDTEVGFLLAQSVAFPQESFTNSTATIADGSGGFQQALVGGARTSSNQLDVTFLETNRDVFSFFIQPWIVAASYKGLIEDGVSDLKCNIDIIQYSRTAERYADKVGESNKRRRNNEILEYGIRKMHTFYNVVPVQMTGEEISYGDLSYSDVNRTVAFIFEYCEINTPRGVLNEL